jgi:hypothetical protein
MRHFIEVVAEARFDAYLRTDPELARNEAARLLQRTDLPYGPSPYSEDN